MSFCAVGRFTAVLFDMNYLSFNNILSNLQASVDYLPFSASQACISSYTSGEVS